MYNFWNNAYKFPRFLVSITLGFFLITFKPIFKSLRNKNNIILNIIFIIILGTSLYVILELMTGNAQ